MNKIILLISLTLFTLIPLEGFTQIPQQEKQEIEQLIQEQIEKNNKKIEDKNYKRIPNEDFDTIIDSKIITFIESKYLGWLTLLVASIGVTGGAVAFYIQSILSKLVSDKLEEVVIPEIDEKERNIKATVQQEFEKSKQDLEAIKVDIKEEFEAIKTDIEKEREISKEDLEVQLKEVNTQTIENRHELSKTREYVNDLKKNDYKRQVDEIYQTTRSLSSYLSQIEYINYLDTRIIPKMEKLFQNTIELNVNNDRDDREFIAKIIDDLVNYYYSCQKYQDIEQLIKKHSEDIQLSHTTYFNASLCFSNSYERTFSTTARTKAIDYLNKSLEVLYSYGYPLALKLEIFMIDYLKNKSLFSPEQTIDNAREVLAQALDAPVTAYETITRLKNDQKIKTFSKYIDTLYELFPEELKQVEELAQTYQDYSTQSASNTSVYQEDFIDLNIDNNGDDKSSES